MANPLPAFNFQVDWGGNRLGFTEVSGLEIEIGVIEYREGNAKEPVPRKIPGLHKLSDVSLKRGIVMEDNQFFDWLAQVRSGVAERRDLTVSLLDEEGQPVVRWKLARAFPIKYTGPTLHAGANRIAIEELQVAHEGLVVENG